MAKAKTLNVKDINAYLFIAARGNHVDLVYHDDLENGAGLGAALASAMEEDDKLLNIISASLLTALESKEKYNSKKSNKVHKKTASKPKK